MPAYALKHYDGMRGIEGADRRYWWLLGAIVVLGLALRIAGAHGALWLDEAWSAKQAFDAGTPLGVFLNINHDNNHHLNSLWLQFVGLGADPRIARAPAILTGTLAIYVAGRIGWRRGASSACCSLLWPPVGCRPSKWHPSSGRSAPSAWASWDLPRRSD